jgi:ABC-2 type transport system permease protein
MMTLKTLTVARWEFVERAKRKSFIIGLFLTPVLMLLFGAGPALLRTFVADDSTLSITVFDGTGVVFDSLRAELERGYTLSGGRLKYTLTRADSLAPDPATLKKSMDNALLGRHVDAAIIIPPTAVDSADVEYRSLNTSDIETISMLETRISRILARHRLSMAGLDPALVHELNKRTDMRTVRVSREGERESGFLESMGISYIFLVFMLISVLFSGQMLVRSLVEEKSNRIVELLVSSCTPLDLMTGKILGISALAMVQAGFWGLVGYVAVLLAGLSNLPLEHLWLMVLYFVLGFLLYAALFVALGCLASTEQEAQQLSSYLTMLLMLPIVLAIIAIQNPNTPMLTALTLIPFLTPQMMFVRLPITPPPLWEILLSLFLLTVSIIVLAWIASRIFRVGILLTGKRPGLREILRWITS